MITASDFHVTYTPGIGLSPSRENGHEMRRKSGMT